MVHYSGGYSQAVQKASCKMKTCLLHRQHGLEKWSGIAYQCLRTAQPLSCSYVTRVQYSDAALIVVVQSVMSWNCVSQCHCILWFKKSTSSQATFRGMSISLPQLTASRTAAATHLIVPGARKGSGGRHRAEATLLRYCCAFLKSISLPKRYLLFIHAQLFKYISIDYIHME